MMRIVLALAALAAPALAAAHPLGNFSVNRYAALQVGAGALRVRYVVDMAEIPAFQAIRTADAGRDGTIDPAERDAYLGRMAAELGGGLAVAVDGAPLTLAPGVRSLELLPGAGGLSTLRLEVAFAAPLRAARGTLDFRDRNFAGRAGWREVVAEASDGTRLVESRVPRSDRSDALRTYPTDALGDLLASPPQVAEARIVFEPAQPSGRDTTRPAMRRLSGIGVADGLAELVATRSPLSAGLVITSLALAAALGALHALGPGHGKTIVGAYLVGARGTARHALFLGLVVTATHTIGVYVLGLVTLTASQHVVPERLLPWISAASGLLVVAIGVSLVASRLRAAVAGRMRCSGRKPHPAEHEHGHGHTHLRLGSASRAASWKTLVALGVSGGLLPCPSALVVMLGAIAIGRIAFGLLLIVAFSAGLAAVLTAVGLALVHARGLFDRLPVDGHIARFAPVASALVISAAGLAIVAQALAQAGVFRAGT
jgi:nickel/cobalt exporter